jgi:hypothetical protein
LCLKKLDHYIALKCSSKHLTFKVMGADQRKLFRLLRAKKNPSLIAWVFQDKRLAIPYFRMANCHTIIGAKRFHFRVRDGIGWFTFAMVTKQTGMSRRRLSLFSTLFTQPKAECWKSVTLVILFKSAIKLVLFNTHQTDWVLYGQASRAISTR